jgi:NTE family protein
VDRQEGCPCPGRRRRARIFHVGVLAVLEEERIDLDLIAGTSAGALLGGAYAAGLSPRELSRKIDEYLASPAYQDSS